MKKLLLFALVLSCFLCAFAITASAEVLEWTETQDLGFSPKTTTDGTVTFDTTSRVMLMHTVTDPDTQETTTIYTTYPAYYILKCTDTVFSSKRTELDFSAINSATGITYNYNSVYKLEIPAGFTSMEDRNFRQGQGMDSAVYVKIPDTVTTIGDYPFYGHEKMQEVEIADSVVNVKSSQMFYNMKSLTRVKFSRGITEIESEIFYKCGELVSVTGFENIANIPNSAFYQCYKLESVSLCSELISVGETAFFACYKLDNVNLGSCLETIGRSAFKQCTSLKTIAIPSSVVNIGYNDSGATTFYGCTSLETVTYGASIVEAYMFDACTSLKTVVLTENVTEIKGRGFRNCTSLSSMNFPEGITTIGDYAFYKSALVTVDLPSTLTTVGKNVFDSSAKLTTLRIRGTVVGDSMFTSCSSLSSVSISMSTYIGSNAFYASKLKQDGKGTGIIFFTGTNYEELIALGTSTANNAYFSKATACTYEEYVDYITNGTVPAGKTMSGRNLLVYGCDYCDTLYDDHAFSEEIVPTFDGGKFISTCTLGQLCTREQCGKQISVSTLAPLFSFRGFSASSYNGSIMQSFVVTRDLIDEYEELFGKISFGLLAAVEKVDSTDESTAGKFEGTLYDKENGKFLNKVATVDFSDKDFDIFEMKVTGLTAFPNIQLYCCAYIIVDGNILYLHNQSSSDSAIFFTPSLV